MNKVVRIVIILLIASTSFSSGAVFGAAQNELLPQIGESSYTMQSADVTVDIGDSGEAEYYPTFYSPPERYSGPAGVFVQEDVAIKVENTLAFVTVMTGSVTPESWNSVSIANLPYYVNSATMLGHDADAESGWMLTVEQARLDIVRAAYHEVYANTFGDVHTAILIYSDPSETVEAIEWFQNNLTLNGESLLTNTDLNEVEAMLDGTSETEPVEIQLFTSTVDDWSNKGLVSESEWSVPDLGVPVEWDTGTLAFPFHKEDAITSSPETNTFSLLLQKPDYTSELYLGVGENVNNRSTQDWAERWGGDEWLGELGYLTPAYDYRFTETRASVIYGVESSNNRQLIHIREGFFLEDGTFVYLTLISTPERIVDFYFEGLAALTIDGDQIESAYSETRLQAIVTDASTGYGDTPVSVSTPASDWSDMGLVSDIEWQSPAGQTLFTWDANLWSFPADQTDAITVEDGHASLRLVTPDGAGEVILSTDTSGMSIDAWYDALLSDEWAQMQADDGMPFTVVDSYTDGTTASAILLHHAPDADMVVIIDFYENEHGVVIITEITAAPEDISSVYAAVWEGVQSDGELYPLTWALEDIEALPID